jgi:hypothetical protein
MDIRMESVREKRIDLGWRSHELDTPLTGKPPFLCYGIISSLKRQGAADVVHIRIRKEFYDVDMWIDVGFVHEFLDTTNGDFPDWMDEDDVENAFIQFSGKRFDFYESEEFVDSTDDSSDDDCLGGGDSGVNMSKIDGADFDIYFTVERSMYGMHNANMILSSDISEDPDTAQKFSMRFPRGPTQRDFNNGLRSGIVITMREHLTCLQHAAKCPFTRKRVNMVRSVISSCNPLIGDGRGRTAVDIMEKTLEDEGAITTKFTDSHPGEPWRGKRIVTPPCKTDELLVKRMRQDHDEIAAFLNLGVVRVVPTGSMEIDTTAHPVPETTNKKNKKKKNKKKTNNNTLVSPFHKLPMDVCRMIHGFICPLRQ